MWQLLSEEAKKRETINIGHPYGIMDVDVHLNHSAAEGYDEGYIESVGVGRTARMILEGRVYVPATIRE